MAYLISNPEPILLVKSRVRESSFNMKGGMRMGGGDGGGRV